MAPTVVEIETPHGLARAHIHAARKPRAALVLGHGAGGGVEAPDLVTARDVALESGLTVALVEQPYRVAGRRSPAPAAQLDAAWTAVVEDARREPPRTASPSSSAAARREPGSRAAPHEATAAVGVLCLAFPLVPPRRTGTPTSRLPELDAVGVPTLVVQGAGDRFGVPPAATGRTVVVVRGDHSLRSDLDGIGTAVRDWLAEVVP